MSIADFIEATAAAQTPDQLDEHLVAELGRLGFEFVVYCEVTRFQETGDPSALLSVNTMPDEWVSHYIRSDYSSIDPMIHRARHSMRPFAWQEAWDMPDLMPRQRALREESRAVGMAHGITVPLFGPSGSTALISAAGREAGLEELTVNRTVAAMATQFHLMKGTLRASGAELPPLVPLTGREREVLTWVARGKSNTVIGEILNISDSSVNFHITNVMRKLDASTRVMAVLKALRNGLIAP
ncbi:LuxR family transcriptional regulator [Caenispirillum bisanense]|uniref:helix-turn-helix transcriptional regulator n=1 Tax=Caenispirillum bisanense TaxID=414052 RepID=UPI0031D0AA2D